MTDLPIKPKGFYRTRMRRADGSVAVYHYAWRGGPRIYGHSDLRAALAYFEAYRAANNVTRQERTHVIWTQAEIDQFVAGAPAYVGRILVSTVETGFRSGELKVFSRRDIQTTDRDHALIVLRSGTGHGWKLRGVPVTPRLAQLIAELPVEQERIIVDARGKPFAQKDALGPLISKWRDKLGIRKELHLHDARGTAVMCLVRAGCSVSELAAYMGWSYQYAAEMLVRHAAHDSDTADALRKKLLGRDRKS